MENGKFTFTWLTTIELIDSSLKQSWIICGRINFITIKALFGTFNLMG
jgi:hypothetical protein